LVDENTSLHRRDPYILTPPLIQPKQERGKRIRNFQAAHLSDSNFPKTSLKCTSAAKYNIHNLLFQSNSPASFAR
jgi:hypothetical protein